MTTRFIRTNDGYIRNISSLIAIKNSYKLNISKLRFNYIIESYWEKPDLIQLGPSRDIVSEGEYDNKSDAEKKLNELIKKYSN